MNGFQIVGRDISAHESASTTGKKMANSTVGKSMSERGASRLRRRDACSCRRSGPRTGVRADPARASRGGRGAACGGVRTAYPPKKEGRRYAPPLAIGDSVMLGAVPQLARAGLEVNTRGCRQMSEGLRLIRVRKRRSFLPAASSSPWARTGASSYRQIRAAMRIVGRRRLLVLVTPRESGGGQSGDAWAMRRAARRFPRRVRLLDWVRFSRGQGRLVRRRRPPPVGERRARVRPAAAPRDADSTAQPARRRGAARG